MSRIEAIGEFSSLVAITNSGNLEVKMSANKIYVTLCPFCFGPAWPTAMDVEGTQLVMACHECHYEAEPWNFLTDCFELFDALEDERKPLGRKMTIAGSVSNIWEF